MKQKRIVLAISLVVVLAIVVAFVVKSQRDANGRQLTVGVILPETGLLAQMGQTERQAMMLAQEDLRANGVSVRLLFEDGKGDNSAVAAAANKLLDVDSATILITSTSGASLTAQPIAERHKSLLLAFCTSSEVAANSPATIRFYIGIEEETNVLLGSLRQLPRDTKVGVLYANVSLWASTVSKVYEPFLREHFGQSAVVEQYDLKTKDFRPQLTKLKNAEVSVLIILGYGFEYGPMFNQMVELQMRDSLRIFGGWGFLYTNVPAPLLEGVYVAGPTYVFRRGQQGGDFESRFRQKYGASPNFDAAFAYEVIRRLPELQALAPAMQHGTLKAELSARGEFDGVMGKYHFTREGNMIIETGVGVFRNGVIQGQ